MLKINNVEFYNSYTNVNSIPDTQMKEFVFVGRSNVGKSSLINDLVNKKVAFTSKTPGKTRLINYYLINNNFFFIDIPGYGYAAVSKNEKKNWASMIEDFLIKRKQICGIIFLLDIRRIPDDHDKILNNWFKKLNDISVIYILTKYDKLSKNEAYNQKIKIALELFVDQKEFIYYSIPKKIGKIDLLKKIESILY